MNARIGARRPFPARGACGQTKLGVLRDLYDSRQTSQDKPTEKKTAKQRVR